MPTTVSVAYKAATIALWILSSDGSAEPKMFFEVDELTACWETADEMRRQIRTNPVVSGKVTVVCTLYSEWSGKGSPAESRKEWKQEQEKAEGKEGGNGK